MKFYCSTVVYKICFFLLITQLQLGAAAYYVDFLDGNDSNSGTSSSSAWKHCPGDSAATGNPLKTVLVPGDVVNFKGGTIYRGQIRLQSSGTVQQQITYRTGPGWGTGIATISGAEPFSATWTRCSSAQDCWGNPNWQNIYYTAVPAGVSLWNRLYQDTEMLHIAQSPDPSDPIQWDRIDPEWHLADSVITRSSLTDISVLTASDSTYYDGAYVGVWVQQNRAALQPILSYSPTAHSIGFTIAANLASPYTSASMARYTLLNHPALINSAGEYAIRPSQNRLYLWPKTNASPSTVSFSAGKQKFLVQGSQDFLRFENLAFANTFAHPELDFETEAGGAISIGSYPTGRSGNVITNCLFRDLSSPEIGGHIIYIYTSSNNVVAGNRFVNCMTRGVIFNGGSNNLITRNILQNLNGTMIEFWNNSDSYITENTLDRNVGCHANAITAYDGNNRIYIRKNKVSNAIRMLTFQAHQNLEVANNVFDGSGIGTVHEWNSTMQGYVRFLNNTIIRAHPSEPVLFLNTSPATYVVVNNILDGVSSTVGSRSNNIYTRTTWLPSPLSTKEVVNSSLNTILPDLAAGSYMISANIGANLPRDAGANLSQFGFTDDFRSVSRQSPWDIGAVEYQTAGATLEFTPVDFGLVAVGRSQDRVLVLRNSQAQTITGSAAVSAPFAVVTNATFTIPGGQSASLLLQYAPTQSGSNYGSVVLSTVPQTGAGVPLSGTARVPVPPPPSISISSNQPAN